MTTEDYRHLVSQHGVRYVEKRFPYAVRQFYRDHPDMRPIEYDENGEIIENFQRNKLFRT